MKIDPRDFLLPDELREQLRQTQAPDGMATRLQERGAWPLARLRQARRRRLLASLAAGVLGFATSLGGQALLQSSLGSPATQGLMTAQEDAPEGFVELRDLLLPPASGEPNPTESSLRALAELQGDPR